MFKIIVLFSVLALGFAEEDVCPTIKGQENFKFSEFLGKWYQIERYQNEFEPADGHCTFAEFTARDKSTIDFKINNKNLSNGKVSTLDSVVYGKPGVTSADVDLVFGNSKTPLAISIVNVDYKNYAVVWGCKIEGGNKKEYFWILSRDKSLSPENKSKVQQVLKTNKIGDKSTHVVNHSKC